jgi:hypothetical protein
MNSEPEKNVLARADYGTLGMCLGFLIGAALGIILWLVTQHLLLFPALVGISMVIGLTIGNQFEMHEREKELAGTNGVA